MTRALKFRPAARRNVKRLAVFLGEAPESIADALIRKLENETDRLRRTPFIGRPLRDTPLREWITRYGRSAYVIRYTVSDKAVTIVRLWHGKENRPR
ncbi:MAG: type II toxin-antitoxin system RelE/ParE family toxin [Hyphomonadaceae bacterium]|nr:MAG: hypothetical protein FD160_1369 [Caulobacteraceae bacterium]MBT9444160.1 type II toxin-antitoxin system RelE/ParE family toxin [Hyphomonadaceae bacterium]TPW04904.1 MAG: hypothetical protein FD124_2417 [Alphaproteobacteria bacterium]